MNRRNLIRLLLPSLLLLATAQAWSQSGPFLFGTVRWHSGPPAHGLEVQLLRGTQMMAATFTDQEGFYAFANLPGQPGEYRILVRSARGVLAEMPVPPVPPGGVVPPITLR